MKARWITLYLTRPPTSFKSVSYFKPVNYYTLAKHKYAINKHCVSNPRTSYQSNV